MPDQPQDALYAIAVCGDGLVLARRVSPASLAVPEIGQPLICYLGDDTASKVKAASWALSVLMARTED